MKRVVSARGRRIEYTLIQSVRTGMLFQVLPQSGIRVYAPRWMRLREIDEMVRERADQLESMRRAVDRRLEEDRRAHPVVDGSTILIEGAPCALRLKAAGRVSGVVEGGELRLSLPRPDSDPDVRAAIRSVLSVRALERIRQRIDHYAPIIGVRPNRVTVRDQKSRWGSCSAKHNLNFNWKLIMAPPQALDYVVIHELCHLKIFNHSPAFWSLVGGYMPDYRAWKKWFDAHRDELYL